MIVYVQVGGQYQRLSGGGLQSEGAEGRYYPRGSMGALCHGHAGGEGQGSEQHRVIMFLKTQHRKETDYVIVCSHHSALELIYHFENAQSLRLERSFVSVLSDCFNFSIHKFTDYNLIRRI